MQIKNGKFKISTFELVNYIFDIKTGNIKQKHTDPELMPNDIFVTGKAKKIGYRLYKVDVFSLIQGEETPNNEIIFKTKDSDDDMDEFASAFIIRDGYLVKQFYFWVNLGKSVK